MSIAKDVNVNGKTVFDTNKLLVYLADYLKTGGGKYVAGLGFITNNYLDELQAVKVANQKTAGRQFRQITIVPSPAGSNLSHEQYMEMGQEIAQYYYIQGYQVLVTMHIDTDTLHFHLMLNSVNFRTGKMFSQSKSELNRFKVHCNHVFDKYGLDPIGKSVDMMLDTVVHEISEGFDCLELFDEIMADKAISLSDLYKEPVAEHQPLYTPEYMRGECIICEPTKTRNYFNPDAPKPWARLEVHSDGSWGTPTQYLDNYTNYLISFMSPWEQDWIRSFLPQRYSNNRRQISGKEFISNPYQYINTIPGNNRQSLFLDNHLEYTIVVDSEEDYDKIVALLNKFTPVSRAEKAYNTKLVVAAAAQLDALGVNAEIKTDNSTKVKFIVKDAHGNSSEIKDVIEVPCEENVK